MLWPYFPTLKRKMIVKTCAVMSLSVKSILGLTLEQKVLFTIFAFFSASVQIFSMDVQDVTLVLWFVMLRLKMRI